jgi:hypothetical protein
VQQRVTDAVKIAELEKEVARLRRRCKTLEDENRQLQRGLVGSITG